MIKNPKSKCINEDCKENAQYGINIPIHCFYHKDNQDINLVELKCKKCDKIDIVNHDGICINFCLLEDAYYNIYRKFVKIKELKIYNLLKEKFGEPMIYNKTIDTECGLERPDIVYECISHYIIIEIDEYMHKKSNYKCEENRIINICFALGMPCIFIRYNPDNFKVKNKIQKITNIKKEELLIKQIVKAQKDIPENIEKDFCRIVYLFYDEFNINNIKYKTLELY